MYSLGWTIDYASKNEQKLKISMFVGPLDQCKLTKGMTTLKKDPTAESRKKDHIDLAFKSQVLDGELDGRFYYEPVLAGHPTADHDISIKLLGYTLQTPIWVSSMTGGTEMARTINTNLARACGEYGMGMGLGSCRSLLDSDDRLSDFDVRHLMPDQPLYANLGIAQIGELVDQSALHKVDEVVNKLSADGLIIHINPLQEWLQPEGDRYYRSPLELISQVIDALPDLKIIVKEVGQGMGPRSLEALYRLPIQAVDFAAGGGTNFAKLEALRGSDQEVDPIIYAGHTAADMVDMVNGILVKHSDLSAKDTIISGGVKTYLDGYYLTQKLQAPSIYGQASSFLKKAMNDYEELQAHIEGQRSGLQLAHSMLTVRI